MGLSEFLVLILCTCLLFYIFYDQPDWINTKEGRLNLLSKVVLILWGIHLGCIQAIFNVANLIKSLLLE